MNEVCETWLVIYVVQLVFSYAQGAVCLVDVVGSYQYLADTCRLYPSVGIVVEVQNFGIMLCLDKFIVA